MKKRIVVFLCIAAVLLAAPAWAVKPVTFGFTGVPGVNIGTGMVTWSGGQRSLASYGQNLYAAWPESLRLETQPGYYTTYNVVRVATSTDSGLSWGPGIIVGTQTGGYIDEAVVAVSDNNGSPVIHVVWGGGGGVYYVNSTNNGASFGEPVLLASTSRDWSAGVAAQGGYVHVVWDDSSNSTIWYSRSTDYGATWSAPQVIQSSDNYDEPNIAANAIGKVYIAWMDFTAGQQAAKLRVSTDNGATWGGVSQYAGQFGYASLAVDNTSKVYILTYDNAGTQGVVCLKSPDDGATWSESLIGLDPDSESLSIALGPSGNPNIAFGTISSSSDPFGSIYFGRSTDSGASFTITRVDDENALPNLAMDANGKANIFWKKKESTGYVIYFTKEQ